MRALLHEARAQVALPRAAQALVSLRYAAQVRGVLPAEARSPERAAAELARDVHSRAGIVFAAVLVRDERSRVVALAQPLDARLVSGTRFPEDGLQRPTEDDRD